MNIRQKMKVSKIVDLIEDIKEEWILRVESDSFIMLINKHSGRYVNLYAKDFSNKNALKDIASILDKHKNIQQ